MTVEWFTDLIDIDECSHFSPCHNNGTCRNTPGSFSCTCHRGWMGANCQLSKIQGTQSKK